MLTQFQFDRNQNVNFLISKTQFTMHFDWRKIRYKPTNNISTLIWTAKTRKIVENAITILTLFDLTHIYETKFTCSKDDVTLYMKLV
jgi:hypothetical protein